jgi:DNA-binding response OmpR family regulator
VARILIADDSDGQRHLLGYALRHDGYQVSEAMDGAQALDFLLREPFDLAMLDVTMPVVDGLTVCRMVRATPTLRDLPIIVLSAEICEPEARDAGANLFFSKPYRLATVRAAVRMLVSVADGGTQVAHQRTSTA